MKKFINLLLVLFLSSSISLNANAKSLTELRLSSNFHAGKKTYTFRNDAQYPFRMVQTVASVVHHQATNPNVEFHWLFNGSQNPFTKKSKRVGFSFSTPADKTFTNPIPYTMSLTVHEENAVYPTETRKFILDPEEGRSINSQFDYIFSEASPVEQEISFIAESSIHGKTIIWQFEQNNESSQAIGKKVKQRFHISQGETLVVTLRVWDEIAGLISERIKVINLETGLLEEAQDLTKSSLNKLSNSQDDVHFEHIELVPIESH